LVLSPSENQIPPGFVEVQVPAATALGELVIELGAQARMRLNRPRLDRTGSALDCEPQPQTGKLSFQAQLKVFEATAPCDLRMNFKGLWAAASERLMGHCWTV
jgi:hypothetical protein